MLRQISRHILHPRRKTRNNEEQEEEKKTIIKITETYKTMETNNQKTNGTINPRCPESSPADSTSQKIKSFIKENRKRLILLAVIAVLTWFILEIISNWTAFLQGFNDGLNQSR